MRRVTVNRMRSTKGHSVLSPEGIWVDPEVATPVDLDVPEQAERLITEIEDFLKKGGDAYLVTPTKGGPKTAEPLKLADVPNLTDESEVMLRPRMVGG